MVPSIMPFSCFRRRAASSSVRSRDPATPRSLSPAPFRRLVNDPCLTPDYRTPPRCGAIQSGIANRDASDMSELSDDPQAPAYPEAGGPGWRRFHDDPRRKLMSEASTVPGAKHYREIAGVLREAARSCQFTGARKEILHLAERFESRADHLDRRARSRTTRRLV